MTAHNDKLPKVLLILMILCIISLLALPVTAFFYERRQVGAPMAPPRQTCADCAVLCAPLVVGQCEPRIEEGILRVKCTCYPKENPCE